MKYIPLCILFISGAVHTTKAQISDVVFLGTAMVNGGSAFGYKLQVTDSLGNLRGYSVTDVMGPNETKTAVRGTVDKKGKHLTFRETRLISTKSAAPTKDFCYIHGRVKLSKLQGMSTLKGSFKGYKEDGKTECGSGQLALVCAQDALDKLLKIAGDDPRSNKQDSITPATLVTPQANRNYEELPDSEVQKIEAGTTHTIECGTGSITMEIWDCKNIDGDQMTILQDNMPILNNHTLTRARKTIPVRQTQQSTVITFRALNEGSEPLNTARVRIVAGENEYYLDATTQLGKDVTLVLKR
jgi:hypothetical protein